MKKLTLILIAILFAVTGILAQTPNQFKYQAVLRDASGVIMASEAVTVDISILQGSASGTRVFTEQHSVTTTAQGLINLNIGSVEDLSVVDFSADIYFVEITVNDVIMGTSQLLSVPYALQAKTAENVFSGDYDDLINQPTLFDGAFGSLTGTPTTITGYGITDAFNGNWSSLSGTAPNISIFTNDAGYLTSATAETDPIFTAWDKTTGISITESQISDLGTYLTSYTETDPIYTANFDLTGTATGDLLKFDGTKFVKFTPNYLTSETDDQNISGSGLSGTILTIGIENGTSETVDLSSLSGGSSSWTASGNNQYSSVSGNVGIGTNSPTHKLTVYNTGTETMLLYSDGTNGEGARLNFGDGDYVYIAEPTDDELQLHAEGDYIMLDGAMIKIGTGTPNLVSTDGDLFISNDLEVGNNVRIDGGINDGSGYGTNGYVLVTNGTGDITWTDPSTLSGSSETDPIFVASPAHGITSGNITNWNTAYGWGNHATAGYLTSYTETQNLSDVLTNNNDGGANKITNIADPVNDQDAATKAYIDQMLIQSGVYTVKDIDGNVYKTVKIGNQIWMAEDLKVSHYPNGDAIPYIDDNTTWGNLTDDNTSDVYSFYGDSNNDGIVDIANPDYGALYTYAAAIGDNWIRDNASGQGVCPDGWHLPTDAEWTELTTYLGGTSVAGGKLKETGTTHWESSNTGATNESGFTALPGGYRWDANGNFSNIGATEDWWSATENNGAKAWELYIQSTDSQTQRFAGNKSDGYSVRCVRD